MASLPRTTTRAALPLAAAVFAALCLWRIRLPGLYYDEVLFVNAALGGVDESFLSARLLGIPIAVMSYIGALKSWLHAPVFHLIGVTPETLRIPSVLISVGTLVLLHRLGVAWFGRGMAAVLVIVAATDPAFVLQARMDHGPTVLMLFFKTASLLLFVRWLERPTVLRLAGIVACLSIGMFDKLNFVWFVVALGGATVLVWPGELIAALRTGGWRRNVVLGAFVAVLALVASQSLKLVARSDPYVEGSVTGSLTGRVKEIAELWWNTATGSVYHRFVFGEAIPFASWIVLPALVGVLAFTLARSRPGEHTEGGSTRQRADWFLLALLALLFAEMVATPQARGGHHALMAWPFHHLFVLAAVTRFVRVLPPRRLVVARVGLAAAAVVFVASQVAAVTSFLQRLDEPAAYRAVWSPASYELAARVPDTGAVVSVDWGIHNEVFALAPPDRRGSYDDAWQAFFDVGRGVASPEAVYEEYFRGRTATVLLFVADEAPRASARPLYLDFEDRFLEPLAPPELVRDAAGRPRFEIRRVRG